MIRSAALLLVLASWLEPRLVERKLDNVALVSVPSGLKGPFNAYRRESDMGWLAWRFESTYLWASMGSIARYKQAVVVGLMEANASDAEYEGMSRSITVSYEKCKPFRSGALQRGTITIWQCEYALGVDRETAYRYQYVERAKRLQIVWHAVAKEASLEDVLATIPRVAASFRVVREPAERFAELRDAPRKDAEARTGRREIVQAMLKREGYTSLEPGKPVLRNGVYLEIMEDPEPRYQLLVPLGRMRAAANGSIVNRPRPLRNSDPRNSGAGMSGTIGWREVDDGDWRFTNNDNDYLPLKGIGAVLTAAQQDRGYVYFYYVGTVRVEETDDAELLNSLQWFLRTVPDVQRRWREGTLVGPGKPEPF